MRRIGLLNHAREESPSPLLPRVLAAGGGHRKLFGGGMTSDPLATLRCGGQRATSPVVKGSVDPWWNHVFKLPVDDETVHSLEVWTIGGP